MELFLIPLSLTLMFELLANSSGLHWKYTLDQTTFHHLFFFSRDHNFFSRLIQWTPDWSLCLHPGPPNSNPLESLFHPAVSVILLNTVTLCLSFAHPTSIASQVTQIKSQDSNSGRQDPSLAARISDHIVYYSPSYHCTWVILAICCLQRIQERALDFAAHPAYGTLSSGGYGLITSHFQVFLQCYLFTEAFLDYLFKIGITPS